MLDIGTTLRHYKRKEIQDEMVQASLDREVAVKYGDKGFGKRPDAITYPKDVLEFAKQRATSFHVSEEHWNNVFGLSPALKKSELDELRKGWDLVIDIDCPDWKISKIVSWLVVRSLRDHDIRSISCKFSGNKGFHIGVPMKAFPESIHGKAIKDWFPDGPKRTALYLLDYISDKYIEVGDNVEFAGKYRFPIASLPGLLGKDESELYTIRCANCKRKAAEQKMEFDFMCSCGRSEVGGDQVRTCQCGKIMEKIPKTKSACECGSAKTEKVFNAKKIIDIDTLLISSRHMYRMPYSLHEKSGLCSVPIDPERILVFEKTMAEPSNATVSIHRFLDDTNAKPGEASRLVLSTFDHNPQIEEEEKKDYSLEYETLTEAIPADFFPPCINLILAGLEDGRKRSMFILINFLSNTGYEYDKIEDILEDWNKRNREELREVNLKGQVRYRRAQKDKVLPPNCDNAAYYKAFGVCRPDNFCPRIKNPVNYAVLKSKIAQGQGKKGRQKLTDEQKEMRRQHREKTKND